jgi:hypothetical protein
VVQSVELNGGVTVRDWTVMEDGDGRPPLGVYRSNSTLDVEGVHWSPA